jgi:hypothetical protein
MPSLKTRESCWLAQSSIFFTKKASSIIIQGNRGFHGSGGVRNVNYTEKEPGS